MKKRMIYLLALCLLASTMLAVTACSKEENGSGEKLVMATNAAFPPYEYHENGKIVGIDAEIAQAIADKLGMELEIVDVEFNSIVSGVASKKYDMGMAGLTVTEDRKESVDFSDSYATGIQSIIVKEGSPITSVDDLYADGAAYVVGVQDATTGDIYSTDDFGDARVKRYSKGADAVQALVTDKVDCVIIDNEPAKSFVSVNDGLVILDTEYVIEDYAICFAKKSDLTAKVNDALKELIADGTVKKIIDKYITAE